MNEKEIINFLETVMESRRKNYYEYKEAGNREMMEKMNDITSELYGILYAIKSSKKGR